MTTLQERLVVALGTRSPPGNQADLARACKKKAPSVSNWFTGKTKELKADSAIRAARYLQVNLLWLTEGIGPMRGDQHKSTESALIGMESPPKYRDDDLTAIIEKLTEIVSNLPGTRWSSVRAQLDILVSDPARRSEVVAELRLLLGAKATPWDGVERRSGTDRRATVRAMLEAAPTTETADMKPTEDQT